MKPYLILPFRFEKLSQDKVLLTNEVGEFLFLPLNIFQDLTQYNLKRNSETFYNLKAKQIATDTNPLPVINMLATKYRTKKNFLNDFTSLHMVVPTLKCNSKCIYCQVSSKDPIESKYLMDKVTAKNVVDIIFKSPSTAIKIEFQGGEPLINFEIVKYIIKCAERLNILYNKSLKFVICTNLTLITREHLEFFKDHDVVISTSLDGPKDIHDANRPLRNGSSAYGAIIRNLDIVRQFFGHDSISALMTITTNNLYRLKDVIDEYRRQGFSSIFLRTINPFGLAQKKNLTESYSIDEFINEYTKALEYIISLNLSGIYFVEEYTALLLRRILTPFSDGFVDIQSPSGATIGGVIYNYNGNVYVSDEGRMLAEMGDERFLTGNVNRNNYKEIFFNEKVKEITIWSVIESLPGCGSCVHNPYCGIDPVRNYVEQADIVGNRMLSKSCYMNKSVMNHLFSLLEQNNSKVLDVFWSWITNRNYDSISIDEN